MWESTELGVLGCDRKVPTRLVRVLRRLSMNRGSSEEVPGCRVRGSRGERVSDEGVSGEGTPG